MKKENIEHVLENQRLKKEFEILNLDPSPIFEYTPDNLELENRRLEYLLEFTKKYLESESQKVMESLNMPFPPVMPGISPDSDWYRFKLWLQGEPVRKPLEEQLPKSFRVKRLEEIQEGELENELELLIDAMGRSGFGVSINEDVPTKVFYQELLSWLSETKELFDKNSGGMLVYDGCSGYCPGCFQRPWCESGTTSCWTEDEEAGKMDLIDELKEFVSPSPQSLSILQEFQAKEDKEWEDFKNKNSENKSDAFTIDDDLPDFGEEDDLSFNWN